MLIKFKKAVLLWFDSSQSNGVTSDKVDWFRIVPFVFFHLACLGVIWVGISATALWVALGVYLLRMFSICGIYHRYFSHKTYHLNRVWQFVFAVLGMTAVQRGPIWWSAHHRKHHIHSDTEQDAHSPRHKGFLYSHIGWFLNGKNFHVDEKYAKDWVKFPELVFLNSYDVLVPVIFGVFIFLTGHFLYLNYPQLNTSGMQLLIWGFFISGVVSTHVTLSINSLAHVFGKRDYNTEDDSRNSFLLALLTLGEGWHNNHHHYAVTAQQGFRWWQIDVTFYILVLLEKLRIVSGLKRVPNSIVKQAKVDRG